MAKRIPPNQSGPTYSQRPGKPKAAPPSINEWNEFRAQLEQQGFSQTQIDNVIGNNIGNQSRREIVHKLISLMSTMT
jgi:hypothetical protein